MAKKPQAPMAKPTARRRTDLKPQKGKGTRATQPFHAHATTASHALDDPLAITEAESRRKGADIWRTPPKDGKKGLTFDEFLTLLFERPEEAQQICWSMLRSSHISFRENEYQTIAMAFEWARRLSIDDLEWAAFQQWLFWRKPDERFWKLKRDQALRYCLMFLYGTQPGPDAHRANAHARSVKAQYDDPLFKSPMLVAYLFAHNGLEAKKTKARTTVVSAVAGHNSASEKAITPAGPSLLGDAGDDLPKNRHNEPNGINGSDIRPVRPAPLSEQSQSIVNTFTRHVRHKPVMVAGETIFLSLECKLTRTNEIWYLIKDMCIEK